MIKVTQFIDYQDANELPSNSLGGFGGFFQDGMRWKDYLDSREPEEVPYAEGIRAYAIEHNLRTTGEQHQYSPQGVPVFEDGTASTFSYRAWGDIMAAIWSEAEGKDYSYMDFYM